MIEREQAEAIHTTLVILCGANEFWRENFINEMLKPGERKEYRFQ
jgi:hypothetical protein